VLTATTGGAGHFAALVPFARVVPRFALDQFETAALIYEVGAGVVVPSSKDLKATAPSMTVASPSLLEELRQAVIAVLGDEAIIGKAVAIAAEMATLPGCDACVAYLEQQAGRHPQSG
jgi:UDP:flavonoid glycosyltransferase YjiC (YdhE family)